MEMQLGQRSRGGKVAIFLAILLILAGGAGAAWQLSRPDPVEMRARLPEQKTEKLAFALPPTGEVALGIAGGDAVKCRALAANDARPTASLAKILTALATVEKSPDLARNFTMTEADALDFNNVVAAGGSSVPVVAGENLTERQLLEALLVASADNFADTIVSHVFGDFANYKKFAEAFLAAHEIRETAIGADASGLDAGTKSTPTDLCKLTFIAAQNPNLAAIMGAKEITDFPVAGALENTNLLLGDVGIFAGKTGFTDEAGYNLATVFAQNGAKFVSVVLGQNTESGRFSATKNLINSVGENVRAREISAGETVGRAKNLSGQSVDLVAKNAISVTTFRDEKADFSVRFAAKNGALAAGEKVGTLRAGEKSVDVVAKNALGPGDLWRRITRF